MTSLSQLAVIAYFCNIVFIYVVFLSVISKLFKFVWLKSVTEHLGVTKYFY